MDQSAFVGFIAVAVVLAILYVLPFIFSKKLRPGWLLFTLVIFILDTLFMFIDAGIQTNMIIDYLFHIWVIVSLAIGMSAGYKLKKLPPEEEETGRGGRGRDCLGRPRGVIQRLLNRQAEAC